MCLDSPGRSRLSAGIFILQLSQVVSDGQIRVYQEKKSHQCLSDRVKLCVQILSIMWDVPSSQEDINLCIRLIMS